MNKKHLLPIGLLLSPALLLLGLSCSSAVGSSDPVYHAADVKKIFVKCTPEHVAIYGKQFNYRKAFCYTWTEEVTYKKGLIKKKKLVRRVKPYDVETYHQMFVDMGPIQSVRN